jgi:hypothetical protein
MKNSPTPNMKQILLILAVGECERATSSSESAVDSF